MDSAPVGAHRKSAAPQADGQNVRAFARPARHRGRPGRFGFRRADAMGRGRPGCAADLAGWHMHRHGDPARTVQTHDFRAAIRIGRGDLRFAKPENAGNGQAAHVLAFGHRAQRVVQQRKESLFGPAVPAPRSRAPGLCLCASVSGRSRRQPRASSRPGRRICAGPQPMRPFPARRAARTRWNIPEDRCPAGRRQSATRSPIDPDGDKPRAIKCIRK